MVSNRLIKKSHRDYMAIAVLSTGWGWYGRAANFSFLPLKLKT